MYVVHWLVWIIENCKSCTLHALKYRVIHKSVKHGGKLADAAGE